MGREIKQSRSSKRPPENKTGRAFFNNVVHTLGFIFTLTAKNR